MGTLPTGTVTFLFTDIKGSTKLAQQHPDTWENLRARHHAILQSAIDAYNGYVFQIIGDAFCVAFHTIDDALNAAIKAQYYLQSENWGNAQINVRMGLHTGEAELFEAGYRGYLTMARTQRIMSTAYGKQILLSNASAEMISDKLPVSVRLRDMKENRLKGFIDPERLWQVIAPNLQEIFPPLPSLNTIPNNLPAQVNSFIGRKKEIEKIKEKLVGEGATVERLHTLTGVGGAGKTRLSLQIASKVLDAFKNGVWFIELAPVRTASLVANEIAKTLGLSEVSGKPISEVLKDYLKEKELLLVLDNFDHVIDATSIVKDILLVAPNVKILVTSRVLLRITGEREYTLPLLSVPDLTQKYSLEQMSKFESVRLFIERAQVIRSDFLLTGENAVAIAEICCHLDGLPLAIELAAANIRLLSVRAMLSQLDNRMKFLTSKVRDLPPRQRSLRGAIDWSYELLDWDEKILFRRFSVFEGETNLKVIGEICNLGDLNVYDLVESLVEKSLLKLNEKDGEIRFSMLENIKEYAREKLKNANEVKIICDRHLQFFADHIEEIEPELLGPAQVTWLDHLDQEMADIRSAIQWAKENHQAEILLELTGSLRWFWQRRGYFDEGINYLQEAIAESSDRTLPNYMAEALNSLGLLFFVKGDYALSTSILEQGIQLSRQQQDKEELAFGLTWLCPTLMRRQKFDEAQALVNESLELYTILENKWGQGISHFVHGRIDLESGKLSSAQLQFQQSAIDFRQSGDLWGQALTSNSLGSLFLQTGKLKLAQTACEKSLALRELMRDQWGVLSCYLNLGDIARLQNSVSMETYYYRNGYELGLELGLKGDMARAANCLGFAALHSNDVREAIIYFSKSLKTYREIDHTRGICECLAGYASTALHRGKLESAAELLSATDTIQKLNRIKMWLVDQTDFNATLKSIHEHLDEARFRVAWERGHDMTLEQAITFAFEFAYELEEIE